MLLSASRRVRRLRAVAATVVGAGLRHTVLNRPRTTAGWARRSVCLLLAATALALVGARPAHAGYTTTIVNFDAAGNPVTRYDTNGNAVDAHDGTVAVFGGLYYLYGTSYDCGYGLLASGTRFCGFKVYSSPDLVHWTDRGPLFDATTKRWQDRCAPPMFGCYRPHVVFNARTGAFVLWINGYDNRSGYHVLTSHSPVGPFTEQPQPTLAVEGTGPGFNNGDMDVFVDDDGKAYLAYTDIRADHDQVVERLNAEYTSGTGAFVRLGSTFTEAPSLFRRGDIYYHLIGPTCAYCGGTGTVYRTSTTGPLGPWSAATTLTGDSCGGQPAFVARLGSTYLYGSDLWNAGAANQALANYYWAPLTFTADGRIQPIECAGTVAVSLDSGSAGHQVTPPGLDQSDGVADFRTWCDIRAGWRRMQTFVAGRSGTLTAATYTTFRNGSPDAPLRLDVDRVDATGQPVEPPLSSTAVASDSVGWSPRGVTVAPGVAVTAGERYALVVHSTATTGCYGFAYNDTAPYPGGGEAYSTDGVHYTAESGRSAMFSTSVD